MNNRKIDVWINDLIAEVLGISIITKDGKIISNPETNFLLKEAAGIFNDCKNRLPDGQYQAFQYILMKGDFSDKYYKMAANEILPLEDKKVTANAIKIRVHRAKKAIEMCLKTKYNIK